MCSVAVLCLFALQARPEADKGKKLDMTRWIAGYQGMALAAAANEASSLKLHFKL